MLVAAAIATVAITLGSISAPEPFQLIVPDVPSIGANAYPDALTPAFAAPKLDPARTFAAPAAPTTRRLISFQSFDVHTDNSKRMEGWCNAR